MEYYSSLPKRRRGRGLSCLASASSSAMISLNPLKDDAYCSSLPKRRRGRGLSCLASASSSAVISPKDDPTSSDDEDEMMGQLIYNSSRTSQLRREQQRGKSEGEEELAPQQHTATLIIANPPDTHNKPSPNYNDEVRKQKSLSIGSNEEMESAPKKKMMMKKRIRKSFEQRIEDLRAYKEKHGHVNVKQSDDKSLYWFCCGTRHARKNPGKSNKMLINEERIASLDALGFTWRGEKAATKSFEQHMKAGSKVTAIGGSGNQPLAIVDWVGSKRVKVKGSSGRTSTLYITEIRPYSSLAEQTQKKKNKSFVQRIEDLQAYKAKNGHVNVKKSKDKSLYTFCRDMRHAHNNPGKSTVALTDDRIASLDALGFDWSVRPREQAAKKSFEQRIEDLQAYKEKHGHLNVKHNDDKSLHHFCKNMRHAQNNPEKSTVALTVDRIATLDALGFEWSLVLPHYR